MAHDCKAGPGTCGTPGCDNAAPRRMPLQTYAVPEADQSRDTHRWKLGDDSWATIVLPTRLTFEQVRRLKRYVDLLDWVPPGSELSAQPIAAAPCLCDRCGDELEADARARDKEGIIVDGARFRASGGIEDV